MKIDEIRGLEPQDLRNRLKEIDEQSFRLRFQASMGQTDGVKKARMIRKDRARILTILREQELAEAKK
jgi:large subunit ribosomal protein L29